MGHLDNIEINNVSEKDNLIEEFKIKLRFLMGQITDVVNRLEKDLNTNYEEEERKIDPLSSLFEFLGHLRPGEKMWIQMLVRPEMSGRWKKEGEEIY